jgi:TP901 family phage tail tape measure protein
VTFGPEMGSNELLVTAMLRDELSPGLGVVRKELAGVADAQTEVAATSKAASAGLDRTAASAEGASRKLTAAELSGRNAAGQFRTLGLSLPKTAAALAITAAGAVFLAQRFESSMTRVNTQAGASLSEVRKLGGELLRMAPSVGITPDKLAESLYHVESAGFRGATALDAVRASAHGAAIGNANLEDVTQAMIASLASGIGGVHGADDAMALLNRTVGIGDMRMQQLARALATGILPSARSAGLQFEDVAAALATITDNATPADEAATRLRMTFALMSSPSQKATDALGSIGMKSSTLAEDMRKPRGLLVALTDLQAHLAASGKSAVQQNQVLEHAFGGGRTSGAILTLLAEMDRLRSKYDELGDSAQRQAEFQAAWATYTDTLSYKWHSLVAGLEAGGITIGQRLLPAAKGLLDVLLATGSAVGSVVGFFDRNRVVVILLAAVITGLLLPALARTAVALGTIAAEKTVAGLWNLSLGASALVGSLSAVSLGFAAVAAAGVLAWSMNRAAAADAKHQADAYVASLNASTTSLSSIERAASGISKEIALGNQKYTGPHSPKLVDVSHGQADVNAQGLPTMTLNGKTFTEVIGDTKELTAQRDKLLTQAAAMRTNEANLGSAYGLTGVQVEALAQRYGIDLTGALSVVGPKFDDVMKSIAMSHDPAARAAADVRALADSSTAAADAVTALKDSLDALIGNAISADEAAITFRDRIVDLAKALKTSHGAMDLTSAKGRVARQSFDEAASSVTQWVTAVQQSTNSVPKTAAALKTAIDMLAPFASHNDYAAQKVRALRHELDLLQGRIDALHGKDVTVGVRVRGGRMPVASDTPGPRASGLGDAMGFHARVSGGVPGKRFVTSHMRSWGLGSANSDHATGRAYDLVGPNLGSYAAAARRAGGFAEFHGAGPGRHLHVAAGDTPGPRGGASSGGDGAPMVVVHVAPGAIVVANPRDDAEISAAVEEGMARGVQRGIERARVPASTWGAH